MCTTTDWVVKNRLERRGEERGRNQQDACWEERSRKNSIAEVECRDQRILKNS